MYWDVSTEPPVVRPAKKQLAMLLIVAMWEMPAVAVSLSWETISVSTKPSSQASTCCISTGRYSRIRSALLKKPGSVRRNGCWICGGIFMETVIRTPLNKQAAPDEMGRKKRRSPMSSSSCILPRSAGKYKS